MNLYRTPLYTAHQAAGAHLVPFAGWEMPLHYGSQLREHQVVRTACGLFDVSHMLGTDFTGTRATAFLRQLLANDVARLAPGQAQYGCLLDADGHILDDIIVYNRGERGYRIVSNAGTRTRNLAWYAQQAQAWEVRVQARDDLAMLALQGPQARTCLAGLLPPEAGDAVLALPRFAALELGQYFIARTGYTGEDGFEIILPAAQAPGLWQSLRERGAQPCGLGARDTLRLEAGMLLYGTDMDSRTTPLDCGLGWTVAWTPAERDFMGRAALVTRRAQAPVPVLRGVMLRGKGVLRNGMVIQLDDGQQATLSSGGFAPTLQRGIGLTCALPEAATTGQVSVRGQSLPVVLLPLPLVRQGRSRVPQEFLS